MTSYFHAIAPIQYRGAASTEPLAFRHYDKNRLVLGKRMEDHLRFAVCYWHNFVWTGLDPFGGATFERILPVLPFLAIGFLISLLSARKLNSLALGDELAAGLGERVALARGVAALGAILLCGATTAVCGPIGFLGLVVPHLCRLLVGIDHRWLLPFSAIGGASLLLAADIVGRIVARPAELDVGIVTALVGAPFFIAIVRRQRMREF